MRWAVARQVIWVLVHQHQALISKLAPKLAVAVVDLLTHLKLKITLSQVR
jgi:hypothetical protein